MARSESRLISFLAKKVMAKKSIEDTISGCFLKWCFIGVFIVITLTWIVFFENGHGYVNSARFDA